MQHIQSSTPCDNSWPPFYLLLFTSDGLNLYFSALTAHFGQWLAGSRRGRKALQWQVAAGLIYGQVKKSYRRSKLARVTHLMRLGTQADLTVARPRNGLLWAAEHRFHRADESDRPPWRGSAGTSHVGHGEARPTTAGPFGMVASLVSFCAPPRSTTNGARAAGSRGGENWWRSVTGSASQRWQREEPTVDGQRGKSCAILCRRCHA
jgi:hypothetical protein